MQEFTRFTVDALYTWEHIETDSAMTSPWYGKRGCRAGLCNKCSTEKCAPLYMLCELFLTNHLLQDQVSMDPPNSVTVPTGRGSLSSAK